jgi:quercetin dioxygenase-like cupin family protein
MSSRRAVESLVSLVCLCCLAASPALAQSPNLDSPTADAAHHKVEFENDRVRVVRWSIAPHDKTALHNHPPLVSILLTDMNAKATSLDGKVTELHAKAGSAAWRGPVVHVVENVAEQPVAGILVEPKGPGNAAWVPPPKDDLKVDPQHHKVEFENDLVRVERYWLDKGEKAPMHDHPDVVQVALTDASTRATTPDGKVAEGHLKAGQVNYRQAISHAVENIGPRYEGLLIVLKGGGAK